MVKRSLNHPVIVEKHQSGCKWDLINSLDFRQGHISRKLLFLGTHAERHDVGNGDLRSRIDFLTSSDEKCQGIDDGVDDKTMKVDIDKCSVKNHTKILMSPEKHLTKRGTASKSHKKARKTCQRACKVPVHGSRQDAASMGYQQPFYPNSVGKSLNKLNPETMMGVSFNQIHCNNRRVCCDRQKCIGCSMHDRPNEINLPLIQMSQGAEAFINQKLVDVFRSRDGADHQSKQFLEVLEILNSNKEIFMKLLQDPNSLLMKHIQNLRDYQAKKDRKILLSKTNSLKYWFTMETPWKEPVCTQKRSMHVYLWKKIKFLDKYPLKGSGNPQILNIMEVPRTGPASMQNFENCTRHCSSSMSNYSLRSEEYRFRPASLSFTNIKRKLKDAIGGSRKEQLWSSTVQSLHKFSFDCLYSKNGGDGIGGKIAGSSGKAYSGESKIVKSSIFVKRSDNIYKTKDSELSTRHEVASISEGDHKNLKLTAGYGRQRECSIYVEANKNISEILSDGVQDRDFSNIKVSRTLEKILYSPEHYFSPILSPGRGQNHGFVTAQMSLSPHTNYYATNENSLQIQEENKNSCPSPARQNAVSVSSPSADKKHNDQSHIKPLNIDDVFPDTGMDVNTSSVPGYMKIQEISDYAPLVQSHILEVPSESNNLPTLSANQCTARAKSCEEYGFLESLKLDLPLENQQPGSLLVVSPSSPISIHKMEDLDSIKGKVEQPSPISVLEPFFVEDVTSPADTISQSAQPPIQPHCINFEEHCSSGIVVSPSDPEINLSTGMDGHASACDHIRSVLQASSLNWDELVIRGHFPHQLDDLNKMEVLPTESCAEDKLLFDCINEVLVEIYQQHFGTSPWVSFLKPNIRPVSGKNCMVQEVINGVDRHLLPQRTLPVEQRIVKDMEKPRTWVDIRIDIEDIAVEMVEGIVQELTEETIVELQL